MALRKEFELFANVRPTKSVVGVGRFPDVDLVLVRENVEGLYVGVEHFVRVGDDPQAVGGVDGDRDPHWAANGSSATPSSTRSGTAGPR